MRIDFFALLLGLIGQAPLQAEVIKIRADIWCPFNCDPKDPKPGYMVELAKAAFETGDDKVDYQTLNWARAITETRDGRFQGLFGAAESDAPDFIYPSKNLGVSRNCFYVKSDNKWEYKGLESLSSIIIAVIRDYTYGEPLDTYVKVHFRDSKKIDIVSGDNPLELNLKKLIAGRVGAYVEDENVYSNYILRKDIHPDVKSAGCMQKNPLFIAFSPKYPRGKELAQKLVDKMTAMRKDGSWKKLLDSYGIKDF